MSNKWSTFSIVFMSVCAVLAAGSVVNYLLHNRTTDAIFTGLIVVSLALAISNLVQQRRRAAGSDQKRTHAEQRDH